MASLPPRHLGEMVKRNLSNLVYGTRAFFISNELKKRKQHLYVEKQSYIHGPAWRKKQANLEQMKESR